MERQSNFTPQLICQDCESISGGCSGPATLYVHLHDGHVEEVTDATGLHVTDLAIVICRGDKPEVRFGRDEVFYACCNEDRPPVLS